MVLLVPNPQSAIRNLANEAGRREPAEQVFLLLFGTGLRNRSAGPNVDVTLIVDGKAANTVRVNIK